MSWFDDRHFIGMFIVIITFLFVFLLGCALYELLIYSQFNGIVVMTSLTFIFALYIFNK